MIDNIKYGLDFNKFSSPEKFRLMVENDFSNLVTKEMKDNYDKRLSFHISQVKKFREFMSSELYEVGKETDTGVIVKRIENHEGMKFLNTYLECELQDHSESITWYDAMKININEYDVVYQFLLKNGANKLVFECLDKLALSYTEG